MESKYILSHLLNIYAYLLAPREPEVYERLRKGAEQVKKDYQKLCKIEEKVGPMPELSEQEEQVLMDLFGF